MVITIIAVGKNMPAWVAAGFNEYVERMPSDYAIRLVEIPLEKRMKNSDANKAIAIEEAKILAAIDKDDYCITLDRIGKARDTKTLAKALQTWHDNRQSICFVIGGPEGLTEAFLQQADEIWSLSAMTLPHPLVRIVIAEQIYRAWSITINHPYHR